MSMPAEVITASPTLRDLLEGIAAAPPLEIAGISSDSRKLQAGDVFLACQGETSHGLDYLNQAVEAGVAAVVWDASSGEEMQANVPMVPVQRLSTRIGEIANRWFGNPSREIRVTGVTGTNGKTTVAYLIQQSLNLLGRKCGYVGTLGSGMDDISGANSLTTPPCIELHETFADFRAAGADYAALEVSSHALEQLRVDGVRFEAALFTNLSRDHIDYHGGMRSYFETKASLFFDHDVSSRIVNLDCDFGTELARECGDDVICVSARIARPAISQPFVFVRSVQTVATGSKVAVSTTWGDTEFFLPMPGEFNVANAALVLALLLSQDVPLDDAGGVFNDLSAPPGRMQCVRPPARVDLPKVYVDYSHTPASLEVALTALRGHCKNKLWCVFGCGGDRDRGKRPMMGEISERLADVTVLTNDNPRSEVPAQIIADILQGMRGDPLTMEDRGAAIAHAIASAGLNDTVLIAGKGHENYQIVGAQTQHFSDYEVAARELSARASKRSGQS